MHRLILLPVIILTATGCASVATNRYLQHQRNPVAVGATENGVTVAVDLFSLDVVRAHPWATAGAALADAAAVFGTYHIAEKQGWVGRRSSGAPATAPHTQTTDSGDNIRIQIHGDNNTITLSETHTPPAGL